MEACKFIISRGKNKGNECGRKVIGQFCRIHEDTSEVQEGCKFIISRGLKKGCVCNKPVRSEGFCYTHSKDEQNNTIKCTFVITQGVRKGEICGRRSKAGLCTIHENHSESIVFQLERYYNTADEPYAEYSKDNISFENDEIKFISTFTDPIKIKKVHKTFFNKFILYEKDGEMYIKNISDGTYSIREMLYALRWFYIDLLKLQPFLIRKFSITKGILQDNIRLTV